MTFPLVSHQNLRNYLLFEQPTTDKKFYKQHMTQNSVEKPTNIQEQNTETEKPSGVGREAVLSACISLEFCPHGCHLPDISLHFNLNYLFENIRTRLHKPLIMGLEV